MPLGYHNVSAIEVIGIQLGLLIKFMLEINQSGGEIM